MEIRRKIPGTGCAILGKLLRLSVLSFSFYTMGITFPNSLGRQEDQTYQYIKSSKNSVQNTILGSTRHRFLPKLFEPFSSNGCILLLVNYISVKLQKYKS